MRAGDPHGQQHPASTVMSHVQEQVPLRYCIAFPAAPRMPLLAAASSPHTTGHSHTHNQKTNKTRKHTNKGRRFGRTRACANVLVNVCIDEYCHAPLYKCAPTSSSPLGPPTSLPHTLMRPWILTKGCALLCSVLVQVVQYVQQECVPPLPVAVVLIVIDATISCMSARRVTALLGRGLHPSLACTHVNNKLAEIL